MHRSLEIRRLAQADALAYCTLRRRSLEGWVYPVEPQVLHELEAGIDGIAVLLACYPHDGIQVWGAFDDKALVGAAALSRGHCSGHGDIGILWGVFVLPRYRGTATSRLLMEAVIDHCRTDRSITQIAARCAPDNVAGRQFLQRFSFEPTRMRLQHDQVDEEDWGDLHVRSPQ